MAEASVRSRAGTRSLAQAQSSDRLDKACTFKLTQDVLSRFRRVGPRACDLVDAGIHDSGVNVDLVKHEVVGELCLNVPRLELLGGKSFVFVVTMTWAPLVMAAASTCRSSGSGSSRLSISCS